MSQEIDAGVVGSRLVGIQHFLNARKHPVRYRHPIFVVHEAVEQRAKRGFHRCVLRTDHGAADHLWAEWMCVDGSHEADRVSEVGAQKQQIATAFGGSVDDRHEIFGRQRIGSLVDDLEAILL